MATAQGRGVSVIPFTVTFDQEKGCIRVACIGDLDLPMVQTVASEVARMIERTGCQLILNDLREATLTEHAFDVYRIPRIMTEVGIGPTVKRALVVGDHQQEFHFLETVFLNYGNQVRTFAAASEAEAWLLR